MSDVPAWKRAIFERRKKAEDEEKKKQAEEEAYLATIPPWKRALMQKREKEKQQYEREKAATDAPSGAVVGRENSFQKKQQQQQQQQSQGGWNRRVTPPSHHQGREPASPTSPTSPASFFTSPSSGTAQQAPSRERLRRGSITAIPGADEPITSKVAATSVRDPEPTNVSSVTETSFRERSSSESVANKNVVSRFKSNVQSHTNEMPAWKKALLERRKGKSTGSGLKPQEPSKVGTQSLPISRKDSPEEDKSGAVRHDGPYSETPAPSFRRTPSPSETANSKPLSTLGLQRKPSPPVGYLPHGTLNQEAKEQSTSQPVRTGQSEPKSLGLTRTPSPVETLGAKFEQKQKPPDSVGRASSSVTSKPASGASSGAETKSKSSKSAPVRSAPIAPSSSKQKTSSQSRPQHNKQPGRPPSRPTPEVVNRGGNTDSTVVQQSEAIRSEGVKHVAPVYKEVLAEWANVSEDDHKFRNLPAWKQALIRRRRADIAKRMGHTTSVDDVPVTNGHIQTKQERKPGIPSGNRMANAPSKKPTTKPEGVTKNSVIEKNHTSFASASQPSTTNSNVKALLGRFNKPSPAPPPPTTTSVPKVTFSRSSRSPSPSSPPYTSSSTTFSNNPASSTTTTTATTAPTRSGTKKSFTWTPGEDTMPGDALSDDSSEEEGEEGEFTVTNLDDTSDDEEEEDDEEGEEGGGVVLLQPPKLFSSPSSSSTPSLAPPSSSGKEISTERVRKTSSILAPTNRPKRRTLRRVAFSETDLTTEHYYPKYDYSDYDEIQNDEVSTGFSFSFWKSRETVEATDGADEQNGLSQRLHPSLRSPESDPDNYRYSPSRDSTQPGHTPPISSTKVTTVTLSSYKPSMLSGYGVEESLQQSYTSALENGTREEGEENGEEDVDGSHLMPADGPPNFYASLSSDTAAMLW